MREVCRSDAETEEAYDDLIKEDGGLVAAVRALVHAQLSTTEAINELTDIIRSRDSEIPGWLEKALGGPLYIDGEGKIVDERGEPYVQNGKQLTEADLA